ncbi:MAG: hypothetical protein SFZ23_15375 [Planctomycetota bacterium]|nr:hypothetical protein [Planctomycetota bacterium]
MSQIGMQMPGGSRLRRGNQMDVYAVLAAIAVVFLLVACVLVGQAAAKVGMDGSPFARQEAGKVKLAQPKQ